MGHASSQPPLTDGQPGAESLSSFRKIYTGCLPVAGIVNEFDSISTDCKCAPQICLKCDQLSLSTHLGVITDLVAQPTDEQIQFEMMATGKYRATEADVAIMERDRIAADTEFVEGTNFVGVDLVSPEDIAGDGRRGSDVGVILSDSWAEDVATLRRAPKVVIQGDDQRGDVSCASSCLPAGAESRLQHKVGRLRHIPVLAEQQEEAQQTPEQPMLKVASGAARRAVSLERIQPNADQKKRPIMYGPALSAARRASKT